MLTPKQAASRVAVAKRWKNSEALEEGYKALAMAHLHKAFEAFSASGQILTCEEYAGLSNKLKQAVK